MPHPDDSFWLAIFRKSPLIASCMMVCGIIGLGICFFYFGVPKLLLPLRLFACVLFASFCAGAFVGLIVGAIADSLIDAARPMRHKKRRKHSDDNDRKED